MRTLSKAALPILGLICFSLQEARSQINLSHSVVAAAPVVAQSTTYRLNATLGQSAIGPATTQRYIVGQGFWQAMPHTSASLTDPTTAQPTVSLSASPLPFADQTEVSIHLPKREHVSLVIYDLLGKPVRTLIDSEQPEGTHSLTLSAEDLPSGRYTAALSAGDQHRILSLLIVR